jgi:hypothetical protein
MITLILFPARIRFEQRGLAMGVLVALFSAQPPAAALANFSGSDNFTVASGSWGPDNPGGAGQFSVQNGELNFLTSAPVTNNDTVQRQWIANVGDFGSDWSLRMDVEIGDFSMVDGQYASVDLLVENLSDPSDEFVRIIFRRDDATNRSVYADAFANGASVDAVFAPTSITLSTLGLSYDANARIITAAYDSTGPLNGYRFRPILTVPIDSGASDWNMTAVDHFGARIIGQTTNLPVSVGQITIDNFVAAGEQLAIVPEPGTPTLMLLAFVAVGTRWRRHYRDLLRAGITYVSAVQSSHRGGRAVLIGQRSSICRLLLRLQFGSALMLVPHFLISPPQTFGASIGAVHVTGDDGFTYGLQAQVGGWQFSPTRNIAITHLGLFDAYEDGLADPYELLFWREDGTLLRQVTVPEGIGTSKIDGFRYIPIDPVRLTAFSDCVVGVFWTTRDGRGGGAMDPDPDFDLFVRGQPGLEFSISNEVSFVASRHSSQQISAPEFPSFLSPLATYSLGASFQYVVIPEPSSAALCGCAIVIVLLLSGQRRKF